MKIILVISFLTFYSIASVISYEANPSEKPECAVCELDAHFNSQTNYRCSLTGVESLVLCTCPDGEFTVNRRCRICDRPNICGVGIKAQCAETSSTNPASYACACPDGQFKFNEPCSVPTTPATTSSSVATTAVPETTTISQVSTPIPFAPANLIGYRNSVGQFFTFAVIGSTKGSIWGTGIYTDDSNLATAAVHAGVVRNGEMKTVTIQILPAHVGYTSSTQNGVTSGSFNSWVGSYRFVD